MRSKKIHHENDHPSGNQENKEWKTARYAMEIADAGPMGRADPSEIEAKISPVAPVRSFRAEREVVSYRNEKENKENELLYLSNGEMPDFEQSIRSDNSHEAGPGIGRSSGSPANEVKGGTNVSSTTPEIIAEIEKFDGDCISVVRDTTPGSGLVQQGAASNKAEDLSYSSGKSRINGSGGECVKFGTLQYLLLLLILQTTTAGCLYFRLLL